MQHLTHDEVEERIIRAMLTALVIPDHERKFLAEFQAFWVETYDASDYPPDYDPFGDPVPLKPKLYEPTRQDHDRFLDDLAWLQSFEKRDRQIILQRSLGKSFASMADRWGSYKEFWRRRYEWIIDRLELVANEKLFAPPCVKTSSRARITNQRRELCSTR